MVFVGLYNDGDGDGDDNNNNLITTIANKSSGNRAQERIKTKALITFT